MPRSFARLLWAIRGKRRVRLNFFADGPSIEGVLVGKFGGHYMLLAPTLIESEEASHRLEGTVEVPELQVAFIQVFEKART